ncbi:MULTISPECIES: response regulator transcription factor [Selenomonas]|uniref:Response regulator transcription factor n=1 Tax=Selenomonas ruminis TaxID=2593411 RepID=A0A5D6W4V2_9FIRM|nr:MULTISPECIES: response regulator transcription factor [unclassified Selenomonas]MBQ1868447.1 response regulator transcription factor [Selenomonas sp.]TYZ23333.1 response regulator transcription factor [Selenomonas sp. mPRGC5]
MRLLIADDNDAIRDILDNFARASGYETVLAVDGQDVLDKMAAGGIDLILLDVMMPKIDGFEVCRKIREQCEVPIIMITARGEDYDRIMGLEIGADDYVVKPFSAPEVMARVKAVLRRLQLTQRETPTASGRMMGNMVFDEQRGVVSVNDKSVRLTHKEFDILRLLAEYPEQLFSRDKLLDTVWGYDYTGDIRTVDTHIRRLRAKLEQAGLEGCTIGTVWGRGYRLEVQA